MLRQLFDLMFLLLFYDLELFYVELLFQSGLSADLFVLLFYALFTAGEFQLFSLEEGELFCVVSFWLCQRNLLFFRLLHLSLI